MHVLVPIARRSTYAQAREFGEIVARTLASTHRGLVTTEWVKRKREGVLIDANQNGRKDDRVGLLGTTARGGARLDAAALGRGEGGLEPADFTMDVVLRRVAKDGDLFSGVLEGGQSLSQALSSIR